MKEAVSQKLRRHAWLDVMGDIKCRFCPHDATRHSGEWDGYVHILAILMRPWRTRLIALTCSECGTVCWRRAGVEFQED